MATVCLMCTDPSTRECDECGTKYCSEECQDADHRLHVMLCKSWKNFQSRPSSDYKRAIFFPADGGEPKFIWIETGWMPFAGYECANVGSHLGADSPIASEYMANWNAMQQKHLQYTTVINFNDDAGLDGSVINESLIHAHGGLLPYPWLGNIVGTRKQGTSRDPAYYGDVDLTDLRHLMDYFAAYHNPKISPNPTCPLVGVPKTMGVKISSKGAIEKFKVAKFTTVPVPRQYHSVFEAEISPISKLVEFPVRVMKYLPSKEMEGLRTRNKKATFLFRRTDPASHLFGWAPEAWQRGIGNVVVVRMDGKDLLPQHLEALCRFTQYKISPDFQRCFEAAPLGSGRPKDWLKVLAACTKEKFAAYWKELAEERGWVNIKSPHEVEEHADDDADRRGDGGLSAFLTMLGIGNE